MASNDPILDDDGKPFKNVAYAFHFYAASHGPEAYYVKQEGTGGYEPTFGTGIRKYHSLSQNGDFAQ